MIIAVLFIFFLFILFSKYLIHSWIPYPLLFILLGFFALFFFDSSSCIPDPVVYWIALIPFLLLLLIESSRLRVPVFVHFHRSALLLSTLGFVITFALTFLCLWLFYDESPFKISMISLLLSCTDQQIVMPFIKSRNIPDKIKQILSLESAATTLLASLFVLICVKFLPGHYSITFILFEDVAAPVFLAVLIGLLAGKAIEVLDLGLYRSPWPYGFLGIIFYFLTGSLLGMIFLGAVIGHSFRFSIAGLMKFSGRELPFLFVLFYLVVGVSLHTTEFSIKALGVGAILFFLIRPISVFCTLGWAGFQKRTLILFSLMSPRAFLPLAFLLIFQDSFTGELHGALFLISLCSIALNTLSVPLCLIWGKHLRGEEEYVPVVKLPYGLIR